MGFWCSTHPRPPSYCAYIINHFLKRIKTKKTSFFKKRPSQATDPYNIRQFELRRIFSGGNLVLLICPFLVLGMKATRSQFLLAYEANMLSAPSHGVTMQPSLFHWKPEHSTRRTHETQKNTEKTTKIQINIICLYLFPCIFTNSLRFQS